MNRARLAVQDDIPNILRMGRSFYEASGYAGLTGFDEDHLTGLFEQLIESETLLYATGGMLGFVVFPAFIDGKTLMAQELFWWVDESERGSGLALELISMMEEIAKMKGVKVNAMLCLDRLDGDRVAKIYEARGYTPRERTYMRVL